MKITSRTAILILTFTLLGALFQGVSSPVRAQYFGRNKIQYENFEFKVLKTEHFDIYFYPETEPSIGYAGRMVERWYARYSGFLGHELDGRQPLIVYASHPQFEQTNAISGLLGEGTGGVTEALKRRIVLPFGGPLQDTDHVIGHELVHAFQYDIAKQAGGNMGMPVSMRVPLWLVEGMAEYLSIGSIDPHTAMWIRDAARHDKLPSYSKLDDPRFFPYRYGQAFLAYIGGTYGDETISNLFKLSGERGLDKAFPRLTGMSADSVAMAWHVAIHEEYDTLLSTTAEPDSYGACLISKEKGGGEFNFAPAVSPDGTKLIFFSEKDLFSINLFLADARTGKIEHTIIQSERDPHLESMQFINSAGAWDPSGDRVAFASVTRGRPVLGILDVQSRTIVDRISLPSLGEILNPTWSPDGRFIIFSALVNGFTDLYRFDLETRELTSIISDYFTDIQPAWSPDGTRVVFVTDRFTADLDRLDTGRLELALLDPQTGAIERLPAFDRGKHINPVWARDGSSVYFISDTGGISNIYRLALASGQLFQVTNLYTGVSGITAHSPALSSALNADRLVFCAYEEGDYNLYTIEDMQILAGTALADSNGAAMTVARSTVAGAGPGDSSMADPGTGPGDTLIAAVSETPSAAMRVAPDTPLGTRQVTPAFLPPVDRGVSEVLVFLREEPADSVLFGESTITSYRPHISLDYIGQPYFIAGMDRFGTQFGGGISMYWSDMLGNHNLVNALQIQSNGSFTDVGGFVGYANYKGRWNWGATMQQIPNTYDRYAAGYTVEDGRNAYVEQVLSYRQKSQGGSLFGFYPFSRATRVELNGGYEHISFDTKVWKIAQDIDTGEIFIDEKVDLPSDPSLDLVYGGAAYVYDFSYYGATSPILGQRYRLDIGTVAGSLAYQTLLMDYRRYLLPKRPFTLAFRFLHYGRYGKDSESERLYDLFLGYQTFVRGYDSSSFSSDECDATSDACPVYEQLFGSKVAMTNFELRFPLLGLLHLGSGYYGFLPLETAFFFDMGVAWRGRDVWFLDGDRDLVKSYGASIRLGLSQYAVLTFDFVNPIDRPNQGWFWQFSLAPGF